VKKLTYLLFDTGHQQYYRKFKDNKEASYFKQFFTWACEDYKSIKFINKDEIEPGQLEIDDQMFEDLQKICKREISKPRRC